MGTLETNKFQIQSAGEQIKTILSNTIKYKNDAIQKHADHITNILNAISKELPAQDKEMNNIYKNNETSQEQSNHKKNSNLEIEAQQSKDPQEHSFIRCKKEGH